MFFRKKKNTTKAGPTAHSNNVIKFGKNTNREHPIFLDPETILTRPKCVHLMFQLKEAIGVNDKYFDEYYLPVIKAVASRLQSMPASEYNHHAYDFGLFEHTLEVAVFAVRSSYQYNYFPDGDEEKIQLLLPLYTYTTFIAAMLHDAGKAFTDVQFKIRIDGDWKVWSPLYANIPTEKEEVEYKIERKKDSSGNCYNKNSHELFGPCLLIDTVPDKGLKWISEFSYKYSPRIFTHLIHALASDNDNASYVGMNVANGDKTSCEDYMANSNVAAMQKETFGELADIPIHEAYIKVIRTILHDHSKYNLSINQRHSSKISHVERYGDMVFLASKFMTELASKELAKQGVSVPADKKVFQILADNKITYKTPTNDTLWWVDFNTSQTAQPRDITYMAVDMKTLANPNIEDLSQNGVFVRFAPKSTGLVAHGDLPKETEYDQELHELVYCNKKPYVNEGDRKMEHNMPAVVKLDNEDKEATIENLLPEVQPAHKPKSLESLLGGFSNKVPEPSEIETPKKSDRSNTTSNKTKTTSDGNKNTKPKTNKAAKSQRGKQAQSTARQSKNENVDGPSNSGDKMTKPKPNEHKKDSNNNTATTEDVNAAQKANIESKNDSELDSLMPTTTVQTPVNEVQEKTPNSQKDSNRTVIETEINPTSAPLDETKVISTATTNDDDGVPFNKRQGNTPGHFVQEVGRKHQRDRADEECLKSLFPFIQQQIDSGSISFNRKDSPIHRVEEGLLIVSPLYFAQFEKSLADTHRKSIKRSSYCIRDTSKTITTYLTPTQDEMKIAEGRHMIHGFLLSYTDFTYKGKPLPINKKLSIKP